MTNSEELEKNTFRNKNIKGLILKRTNNKPRTTIQSTGLKTQDHDRFVYYKVIITKHVMCRACCYMQ